MGDAPWTGQRKRILGLWVRTGVLVWSNINHATKQRTPTKVRCLKEGKVHHLPQNAGEVGDIKARWREEKKEKKITGDIKDCNRGQYI